MKKRLAVIVLAMIIVITPMDTRQAMAAHGFDTRDFGVQEQVEQEDGKRTEYMAEIESSEYVNGAYNGSEFVVFLANGSYMTSSNGLDWNAPIPVMNDYVINEIIADEDGWFYTVGGPNDDPYLLATKDLIQWKKIDVKLKKYGFSKVYRSGDLSYCVGYGDKILVLEGGELVEALTTDFGDDVSVDLILTWTGEEHVILESRDGIFYSKDLKTWTKTNRDEILTDYSVDEGIYFNGMTIMQGTFWNYDDPKACRQGVVTTTDGIHFTQRLSVNFNKDGQYKSAGEVFKAGNGVAVSLNGVTYYSEDGISWQSGLVNGTKGIVSKGGHFASDRDYIYTSLDGKKWQRKRMSADYQMAYEFYDAVSGDKGIAAISRHKLIVSKDGYTWNEVALSGAEGKMHWRVSYALGKYVVQVAGSGSGSTLYVSDDLVHWQSKYLKLDSDIVDSVTYKGQMVAYGRGDNTGRLLTSTNGLDWKIVYEHSELISSIAATQDGILFVDSSGKAYLTQDFTSVQVCEIGSQKASMVYESKGHGYIVAWVGKDGMKDIYKGNSNNWTKVNRIQMDGSTSSVVAINSDTRLIKSDFKLNEIVLLGAEGTWQFVDPIHAHSSYQDNYKSMILGDKLVTIGYILQQGSTGIVYGLSLVTTDPVKIAIDGELLMGMDVPPTVVSGRTLMPVRQFFEAVGSKVSWNGATRTVTITGGKDTVEVQIDSTTAYVNGAAHTLDVAATIVDGRTMVPVRFISEAMGYDVQWGPATRTVMVTTK